MKKFLIIILTFILLSGTVFAYKVTFDSSQNPTIVAYYCSPNTATCSNVGSLIFGPVTSNSYTHDFNSGYKMAYFYKSGKRIIPYRFNFFGSGTETVQVPSFTGYESADLSGASCVASAKVSQVSATTSNKPVTFTVNVNSNLNPLKLSTGTVVPLPANLVNYYYMNTNVKVEIIDSSGSVVATPYNNNVLLGYSTSSNSIPISWTPTVPGNYKIKVITNTAVEQKCSGISSTNPHLLSSFTVQDSDDNGIQTDSAGTEAYGSFNHNDKIQYSNQHHNFGFKNRNSVTVPITAPTITSTDRKIKYIKNYKSTGKTYKWSQKINLKAIALKSHKVKNFANANIAQNFLNKTVGVMKNISITKNMTYDGSSTTTQIDLNNIPPQNRKGLVIYSVISKTTASYLSQITDVKSGGAKFFVSDKDPIIGWYFNSSGSSASVSYTIPGNNAGGTIIITQQPILFNAGDLIVNYRQGSCNAGEADLFQLDDLVNSAVYAPGSGKTYNVCVADLKYPLSNTSTNLDMHIFNYTQGSNASFSQTLPKQVFISVQNSTPIYWSMIIQKNNPTGNYSCLGSVNNKQNSLFGDCSYNASNRIWLHLGADKIPPTTTLSYPVVAHTLRVTLTAKDNIGGSGVSSTDYCIVENSADKCANKQTDFNLYTKTLQITCSNDWGCTKNIQYYSTDKAGNVEQTKTKKLTIIDKGSACQTDCTAKPSPNRYLKECRNLNGCTYYPINNFGVNDQGKYVASQCNFLTKGSWVYYNSTEEIKCPSGPLRKSRFTNDLLDITSQPNTCHHIVKTPYPVIYDGQQLIMNIITCAN